MDFTKLVQIFIKTNNSFENKLSYEKVIVVLRKHWFIITIQVILHLFLLLGSAAITLIGISYFNNWDITITILFLFSLFTMFWWLGLFYAITMYMLDVWIITDHRVVDSEQHGFFSRQTAELNLSRVQDTSVEMKGLIPTFFNYGNLDIQTAGVEQKFRFKEIPNPEAIKDLLTHYTSEYMKAHINGAEVHERASGM
ncbi:MAG: PH domain-containing protein [bacterium]